MGSTRVGVWLEAGRVRLDLATGAWSPRVLSADGAHVRVALVATGALLLGGDDVRLVTRVGTGACVELVDTSGTVAYDGRGRAASWAVEADVDDHAALVWDALPFVVAEGADVTRSTVVRLGTGARVCLRDTLVLGRAGEGPGVVRQRTRVDGPDGAVLAEDLDVTGPHRLPGILGPNRVVDQVLLAGCRPPSVRTDPAMATRLDVLHLDRPGALARRLAAEAHAADLSALMAHWSAAALQPDHPSAPLAPPGSPRARP